MASKQEWELLSEQIRNSDCALLYPNTTTVIGRGSLSPRVVIIGEAPGAEEDKQGLPFVGRSGKLLDEMMAYAGIKDDFYITNVVKNRPPNNRDPTKQEVVVCKPWLDKQLALLDPEIVVCVGRFAMNVFFPKKKAVTQESGTLIDDKYYIIPHPSYFIRRGGSGWQPYLEELREYFGGPGSPQQTLK